MIITTGWGILIPILGIGFPVLANYFVNLLLGAGTFQGNPFYYYFALFLAMMVCFIIGKRANAKFNQNNPSSPNDNFGKKLLRSAGRHTIFFVPMEYGALAIPVIGYFVQQYLW